MQFIQFTAARADTGAVLPRAKVYVYPTGAKPTLAALYDASNVATGNPVTADLNGLAGFAAADALYDIQIISADGSYTSPLMTKVQVVDLLGIRGSITSGRLGYSTYAALAANVSAAAGQIAEVPLSDAGTHTDPVAGGTVNNTGIFRWSASPAGWQRLYDTDAASAKPFSDAAAASATAAAASKALADTDAANALASANGALGIYNAAQALTFTFTSASGGTATTVGILQSIASPVNGQTAFLAQAGREGWFVFSTANNSANVTADPGQGIYIAPAAAPTGASGAWVRIYRWIGVTWFGAVADGVTDDTVAVQRAINMAVRLNVQTLFFRRSDHEYLVSNLSTPSTGYDPVAGLQTLEMVGVAAPSTWFGTLPDSNFHISTSGSILKSTATTGGALLTINLTSHSGYNFSWIKLVMRNMGFRLYDNPQISCIDATWAQQLVCEHVMIDTGVFSTMASKPTHANAIAIKTPAINNGALNYIRDTHISGTYYAYEFNEHVDIDGSTATCCLFGLRFLGAYHASKVGRIGLFRCPTSITFDGDAYSRGGPNTHAVNFQQIDIENAENGSIDNPADHTIGNGWQFPAVTVADAGNWWIGHAWWWAVDGNVGASTNFTVSGGANAEWWRLGEKRNPESIFTSGAQLIGSGSAVPISFTNYHTEFAATKGGDATKIVFTQAGVYEMEYAASFPASATGYRQLQFLCGAPGSPVGLRTTRVDNPSGTLNTIINISRLSFSVNAGDEAEVLATQTSGGGQTLVTATDVGALTFVKKRSTIL